MFFDTVLVYLWPILGLYFKQSYLQGFLLSELMSQLCDKQWKQRLLCDENLKTLSNLILW